MEHLRAFACLLVKNESRIGKLIDAITDNFESGYVSGPVTIYKPELGQMVSDQVRLFNLVSTQRALWGDSGFDNYQQVTDTFQLDTLNPNVAARFKGTMLEDVIIE